MAKPGLRVEMSQEYVSEPVVPPLSHVPYSVKCQRTELELMVGTF